MPANSPKIRISLDLPNPVYGRLRDVAKAMGEPKVAYCRRVLKKALRRDERRLRRNGDLSAN